jgi:hypothetical protein
VTADYAVVIRSLNERFGTSFREFEHTPENVRACFEAMEGYWRGRVGEGLHLERVVGRPSEVREGIKSRLRERYLEPKVARLRERAERMHERWRAIAREQLSGAVGR